MKAVKIIPSIYKGQGMEGDFEWMIQQDKYKSTFFIFNDNESQFKAHLKDPSDPLGCNVGGGNAVIRPYQCTNPPQAGGIPTGPNFPSLTPEVKQLIDSAIHLIQQNIDTYNYNAVVFSANENGGLGTSIFEVPDDVKTYIVKQIYDLK